MKRSVFLILAILFVLILSLSSCSILNSNNSQDSQVDTDSNSDTESDTEIDTDTDSDEEECMHLNLVVDKAVAPSCTKEGLTEGSHCGDCGEIYAPQRPIPMSKHVEISAPDKEPTCKEAGYIGGTYCKICKLEMVKGTEIPALPHTEEDLIGYPSTCDKSGLSDGKRCTVCGTETVKQIELKKLSHTEIVTRGAMPTCQSEGYTEKRQCSVCNTVTLESRVLPIADHTSVIDKAVAPSCSSTGLTEGSHCSVCSKVLVAQEIVPKNNDHVYSEFLNVKSNPSFSSSGTATLSCTKCSYTENVSLAKLSSYKLTKNDIYSVTTSEYNPAYDNRWNVVDGNKNVSGIYSAGDWFGNLGDVLVISLKQEMVLTDLTVYAGGNYTKATIRVKDTYGNITAQKGIIVNGATNAGAPQTHTIVSGAQIKAYTIEIEITELKWSNDPKTLKISEVEIKASNKDARIEHNHVYREYMENTRVATCQQTGIDLYKCFCGHTKEIETKKGEHIYEHLKAVKLVSCLEDGYVTYECNCGLTTTKEEKTKGHIYYKLVEYTVMPTASLCGRASFKCNNCTLIQEREVAPLPIEEVNYLRVDKIENGKVTLKLNIYGERPSYEVRYSLSKITEDSFLSAYLAEVTVEGDGLVSLTFNLDATLEKCYYVAVRPYNGTNYGKIATIRVGGDLEIPIDYNKAQVYHGEVLNSFRPMFDNDITTKLGVIFPNSGDTAELYGSNLSPIVDLEYMHYITNVRLYYENEGKSATVRWSTIPLDFQTSNSVWDGYKIITSKQGWNEIELNQATRYIQIIFVDGDAPYEVEAYGYQCGEGDKIATTRPSKLPTMGEMMGMCGFVAAGGGHTSIEDVSAVGVLREYHNFGWSYDVSKYGSRPAMFTSTWMGNFDYEYKAYTEAGLNVIPCIQWSLGNKETISYKVDENKLPIYEDGKLVRASFWERFDPHTYFIYADSLFAYSARYGSNNSSELLTITKLHCSDNELVGQGTIKWIEMGNEPDGSWNGIHNYLSAYQLAAATSATYDGHCRTLKTSYSGGYHLGIKNADPNMKAALAGVSGVSNEYIMALCYWMKANRPDGDVAFDAFNVHHYMTKQITLPNGSTTYVGISPEEANITGLLSQLIGIRDKYYPEKEVWITEFGWDTNQSYATSTSAHAYAEYTGRQVQAMWLTRTYLLLSATGIDKADMYMCHDTGVEEASVGKYYTSGVVAYEYDENGNTKAVKKDSYYYLYTLKNALSDYSFDSKIEAYDENVMIYKYKTEDGKTAYAVWCSTSDGTKVNDYQLGIGSESAKLIETAYGDIDGISTRIVADEYGYVSVNVSENPIYIIVD